MLREFLKRVELRQALLVALTLGTSSGWTEELRPAWRLWVEEYSTLTTRTEVNMFESRGSQDAEDFPVSFLPVRFLEQHFPDGVEPHFSNLESTYRASWLEIDDAGHIVRKVQEYPDFDDAVFNRARSQLVCLKIGATTNVTPLGTNALVMGIRKDIITGTPLIGSLSAHPNGNFLTMMIQRHDPPTEVVIIDAASGEAHGLPGVAFPRFALAVDRIAGLQCRVVDGNTEGRAVVYDLDLSRFVFEGEWGSFGSMMSPQPSRDGSFVFLDLNGIVHVIDVKNQSMFPVRGLPPVGTEVVLSPDGSHLFMRERNSISLYSLASPDTADHLWNTSVDGELVRVSAISESCKYIALHRGRNDLIVLSHEGAVMGTSKGQEFIGGLQFLGDRWLLEGVELQSPRTTTPLTGC